MSSVRRRLLVTLLAAVAAVTLAAALAVYGLARREIDAIFDYDLRQLALTLRDQVSDHGALLGGGAQGFDFVVQVWAPDGDRLYASRPDAGLPPAAQLGFATVRTGAGAWRVYSAELSGLVIQVAQPLRVRAELAVAAATRTLAPVVVLLPLLALLVWWIVGGSLAPLDRLAAAVGARTPAALARIPEAGVPEEALPLVRAINELMGRLAEALEAQRAFVADAAHELRTPLAALKLQAELLDRAAAGEDRARALADLRAGLERTARVVEQLLALARSEPDAAAPAAREPVPLAELAGQVIADHAVLAEAKGIDLGASDLGGAAAVRGDPAALRILLANLVDNAVRYTPAGGRVDVSAGVREGRPWLRVSDTGPGIPAEERVRVFDRFYRRAGTSEPGSGLGLAIVRAVAGRHGAGVTLGDAPGGGLSVTVEFPADGVRPAAAPSRAPPPAPARAGAP